jgi:hypothetical protein
LFVFCFRPRSSGGWFKTLDSIGNAVSLWLGCCPDEDACLLTLQWVTHVIDCFACVFLTGVAKRPVAKILAATQRSVCAGESCGGGEEGRRLDCAFACVCATALFHAISPRDMASLIRRAFAWVGPSETLSLRRSDAKPWRSSGAPFEKTAF